MKCYFSFRINFAFVLFLLVITTCSCSALLSNSTGECSEQERDALLLFKQSVEDPHNVLSSWVYGSNCCRWRGVRCDALTGEVVRVNVSHGSLYGTVNIADLFQLNSLMHLDLSWNEFSGGIPETIGSLERLTYLDLGFNEFSGGIPEAIGSLERLKHLDLSYCGFSGVIPPQLANLRSLQFLDLSESYYSDLKSGSLSWLKNLTGLKRLGLGGIKMEGQQWRANIARLYNLQSLELSINELTGGIPPSLGNLSSLTSLDLSSNELTGGIPPSLANLSSLTSLDLFDNELNGSITCLSPLSHLQYLDLSSNRLEGSISLSLFQNHTKLTSLSLSSNQLTVNIPGFHPSSCTLWT